MHGRNGVIRPETERLISALIDVRDVEEGVVLLRDRLSIDHVTFQMSLAKLWPVEVPFVRSTYPPQWISRYLLRGYSGTDPVMREGFSRTTAFGWHELEWGERERAFLAEAEAHGLGGGGYSVPVVDRYSRRSLLSLNTRMAFEAWKDFIEVHAAALGRIGRILHDKAIAEISASVPSLPQLAPREAECLLWTARGKEAKAIAVILELSEYTVRSYLRTGRQKLKCRTLSQAVAKAIQYGFINP